MTRDARNISQGLLQRFFRRPDPVPLGNSRSTFLSIFHIRDHIAFSFVLLKMIDDNIDEKNHQYYNQSFSFVLLKMIDDNIDEKKINNIIINLFHFFF